MNDDRTNNDDVSAEPEATETDSPAKAPLWRRLLFGAFVTLAVLFFCGVMLYEFGSMWLPDQEMTALVEFISQQGKPSYELEISQQLSKPSGGLEGEEGIDEDEELIEQCVEVIRSEQKASVSLLQRRLRLGYGRAARIMDELENRGVVGPSKGAEPRDILIDLDGGGADGQPATGK